MARSRTTSSPPPKIPNQTKPIKRQKAPPSQDSPKIRPSHLKKDPIQCPECLRLQTLQKPKKLKGYSALSHHYESQHPECPVPGEIPIEKDGRILTTEKSKRGTPKKKSKKKTKTQVQLIQENQEWAAHEKISNFIADILKCFNEASGQKKNNSNKKKPTDVEQSTIIDEKLSPTEMIQIIKETEQILEKKWKFKDTQQFLSVCMSLVKTFLEKLKENEYPQDHLLLKPLLDSKSDSQLLKLLDMLEENDLEELMEYETKEKAFEKMEKWQFFSHQFKDEFLSKVKKDLLTITWLSGTNRKDLFIEYVYLMGNVMERESRFDRYQKAGRRVHGEMSEEQEENELKRFLDKDEGFQLLESRIRLGLMNLRKEFLMTE